MNYAVALKPLYIPSESIGENEPLAVVLALVKNEGDIISLWLSHICELFNLIYIVDHQSTDGTREFLLEWAKSETRIHLYSFDEPGYFQSEITNYLAYWVAEKYPNAWLFPLDTDEFLKVSDRKKFHDLLKKQMQGDVLLLNWQNCIPYYLYDDPILDPGFTCFFPSQPGIYNKVAVNARKLRSENLKFIQGNHDIENELDKSSKYRYKPFLDILHLPIRSVEHFALKCVQGSVAYSQLPSERNSTGQGIHWTDMINSVLLSERFDADTIRKFVVSYGQSNDLNCINMYALIDLGWTAGNFSVPFKKESNLKLDRKYTFMDLSRQILEKYPQYVKLNSFLKIIDNDLQRVNDMSSWQKEGKSFVVFEKLDRQPDNVRFNDLSLNGNDIDLLNTFFSMAFTRRETPVPSTWEGHVPFLYCLLNFSRPRRFVELGSQYGNCFFAACQISKLLGHSIECVAIDTWAGDEHTGMYHNDVFDQFLSVLHQNYPDGRHIRKLFNDALPQFEEGSIDLLHIDGLHTYDAVAEDFENWRPKLSDTGIIMFHDTQVKERDFGVWRLWADLKTRYPSIEFEHSHGLGVILVGQNASNHVKRLFEIFAKPEYVHMVKSYFSRIGSISPIR
jgi:hypothetical protein